MSPSHTRINLKRQYFQVQHTGARDKLRKDPSSRFVQYLYWTRDTGTAFVHRRSCFQRRHVPKNASAPDGFWIHTAAQHSVIVRPSECVSATRLHHSPAVAAAPRPTQSCRNHHRIRDPSTSRSTLQPKPPDHEPYEPHDVSRLTSHVTYRWTTGQLEHWITGPLELEYPGILEYWNTGILQHWHTGPLQR
jgi:hypothetical protein